jgi:GT2 family glycosyltransferase
MIDISIVIVNYNGEHYLRACFDALLSMKTEGIQYEIIFVDNNSKDNSVLFLNQKYGPYLPNLKVVVADKNLGFGAGNNLGVKNATGEYIVFLNNDTVVMPDWLVNLHGAISRNKNIGIATSKLLFFYDFIRFVADAPLLLQRKIIINNQEYEIENKFTRNTTNTEETISLSCDSSIYIPLFAGKESDYEFTMFFVDIPPSEVNCYLGGKKFTCNGNKSFAIHFTEREIQNKMCTLIQNAGSYVTSEYNGGDIGMGEEDIGQFESERIVDSACGAALIIRKHDFDCVHGFDTKFFMYYEDTDLSFKIKEKKKEIIYCPSAVVRHIHAGSSIEWSPLFFYNVLRSRLFFIYNHASLFRFILLYYRFYSDYVKYMFSDAEKDMKEAYKRAYEDVLKYSVLNKLLSSFYRMVYFLHSRLKLFKCYLKCISSFCSLS